MPPDADDESISRWAGRLQAHARRLLLGLLSRLAELKETLQHQGQPLYQKESLASYSSNLFRGLGSYVVVICIVVGTVLSIVTSLAFPAHIQANGSDY